jgi:hypothetical protein
LVTRNHVHLIERTLNSVPSIGCFLTVDELDATTDELACSNPEVVRVVDIGRSTDGHPIRMLRIGHGEQQLLFFACPHPNEPTGAMALEVLAKLLVASDELRGSRYTWNLIKCIDPDGTRLNEGWFSGPFTVTNYATHFFRPGASAQAEWTFPVTYKTYSFLRPIDETKALMTAITGLRPRFIYSLHNSGMGGGYFYLTPHRPEIDEDLRTLVTDRGIPLALGEPEMPWGVRLSPAIYQTPTLKDQYEFIAAQTGKDPARVLEMGEGSYGFAREICDPAHLMCEVPYFFDPRTGDTSEAAGTRREAILAGLYRAQPMIDLVTTTMDRVQDRLTEPTRVRDACLEIAPMLSRNLEMQRRWASTSPELDTPATVSQVFDSAIAYRFYRLLFVGLTRRALKAQLSIGADTVLADALAHVEERFASWMQELESELDYRAIPIKTLVEIQLGAALHFLPALEK